MINLKPFCSTNKDGLHEPFSISGYTYATNGQVAIRVDRREGVAEGGPKEPHKIESLFAAAENDTFAAADHLRALPKQADSYCKSCRSVGKLVECETCNGTGEHECDCEHCEEDCDDCKGKGGIPYIPDRSDITGRKLIDCSDCEGTGRNFDKRTVDLGSGLWINADYLSRVLALPGPLRVSQPSFTINPDWGNRRSYAPVAFKFDGGMVLIMPLITGGRADVMLTPKPELVG